MIKLEEVVKGKKGEKPGERLTKLLTPRGVQMEVTVVTQKKTLLFPW